VVKQLLVLSGKGGTGKTSVTSSLTQLASEGEAGLDLVVVDADVDAANLELVLHPEVISESQFWGSYLAEIEPVLCLGCGNCERVCRFRAVVDGEAGFSIDPLACEGCGACFYHCPEGAIALRKRRVGSWFRSSTPYGDLFHAHLRPSQENSGKLVSLIKGEAQKAAEEGEVDLILVDGPPGIGCPVISAVSGADLALVVTEPTPAGIHDLKRALETTGHFGVETLVCVNKADLHPAGTEDIRAYCRVHGVEVIGQIPFDERVPAAMVAGGTVIEMHPDAPAARSLDELWEDLRFRLERLGSRGGSGSVQPLSVKSSSSRLGEQGKAEEVPAPGQEEQPWDGKDQPEREVG